MRTAARVLVVLGFLFCLKSAHAVPSFARQTGLSCNVCHRNPPELTPFGRNFKLTGYLLNSWGDNEKVGNTKDVLLSKYLPLSAMVLVSNTSYQANQPSSQNNAAGFPQQVSIFLAGAFASHFGGLAQITYSHVNDHFGMDNTDLRSSNQGKLFGKDWVYGLTMNNNPGVEDLWNSTPVWGFPWLQSAGGVSPNASPLIYGALGQDVAGVGGYSMWNNHLYVDATVYRSEHAGAATPVTGTGHTHNVSGVAPYWRAAWQQSFGANYLEVGTYGIYVNSFPGAIAGPEDRYVDPSFDFTYERPFGGDLLNVHGTYTHEKQDLGATVGAGNSANKLNHLDSFKVDATYHWTHKYAATAAVFSTSGSPDSMLYGATPLTGSQSGYPDTNGYIAQFAYWPVQNIDINVNYTGYSKFNGAVNNYDGANRNASDNNTVYTAVWINF
jgi:hypothetical protein